MSDDRPTIWGYTFSRLQGWILLGAKAVLDWWAKVRGR